MGHVTRHVTSASSIETPPSVNSSTTADLHHDLDSHGVCSLDGVEDRATVQRLSSRVDTGSPAQANLRVTIIAADGLYKRDVFRFPDPFAVATINGEQTKTTQVTKRTLNPYWNESFDFKANEDSILAVQVFDQKKFKKKDQGFLGVINIRIGDVIELAPDADDQMLTRDLKKSTDNLVVHGKLIINLSTNLWTRPTGTGAAENRNAEAATQVELYFVDHNTKTTTWDDPRLPSSLDQNVPQYKRDFRRKLIYFRSQPAMRILSGQCHIKVRRSHIFEDSFAEISRQSATDLKKRLMIKFDGEDGLDYGGLSREFFFLLSHEMFNPFYCLFEYSAHDNYTLQINPHSGINPEHLNYFKFIGRVVGLAIFHRRFLDAFFIGALYKMVLGKSVVLADMEGVDADFHRSLQWMLDNDISGGILEQTFSTEDERFGVVTVEDLIPNGRDIDVTNENKKDYVDLMVKWRIEKRIAEQFQAFKEGFHELIPQDLINVFDERELELLIGGIAEIDVDDWKKHTDYRGYTESDEVIQFFWQTVRCWDGEQKSRLLQFTTGTSRIPVNGFKDLQGSDGPRRFTIEKAGEITNLPKAHTCFNRLDLPPYKTLEMLQQKMTIAVEETMGFGQE
ncbi:hypothetical protein P8C59_003068 [Phyllachora maydis]|uniref:HECT-type E3 ubiquitin transferase n=1 Tax=Phyllachora maydis TaxID=1825666 RepID=A0AAD9M9Y7_9PEZI|nr:hypothetical protein P8C59_003068 [Phyllachora maydis]